MSRNFDWAHERHSQNWDRLPWRLWENSQSPVQRRLSVYNWNCGLRRDTEDEIEKLIASKWHLTILQEASDYVEHEILHEHFHVTHFASCAVLFNKHTFHPDVSVKSIYLYDTKRGVQDYIVEDEHGWVLQDVVSHASFSYQTVFTVLSLHINSVYVKKRGIAKNIIQAVRAPMISQDIDLIADDFNCAAWRCRSRDNLSFIDETFADCPLSAPPGTTPLRPSRTIGRTFVGFLKSPVSALGLRVNDQSCHHETWLHLQFVDWSNQWNNQIHYNGNISLKKRPASSGNISPKRNIREVLSNDLLSSWLCSLVFAISLTHHYEVTWWDLMSWPDWFRWGSTSHSSRDVFSSWFSCLIAYSATSCVNAHVSHQKGVLKSKDGGTLSINCCDDFETLETVSSTIISVNQLSLHSAVVEMCEEYESSHDRTERSVVRG